MDSPGFQISNIATFLIYFSSHLSAVRLVTLIQYSPEEQCGRAYWMQRHYWILSLGVSIQLP